MIKIKQIILIVFLYISFICQSHAESLEDLANELNNIKNEIANLEPTRINNPILPVINSSGKTVTGMIINSNANNKVVTYIEVGKYGSKTKTGILLNSTNAKDLVQIFQNISKSLSQSRPVSVAKGKKNSSSVAKQIATDDWNPSSLAQSGSNKLSSNQGYAFIENFQCYHCNDSSRVVCGGCNENLCGGGIKNSEIRCPVCSVVSEVEASTKAFGKVGAGGKSKGK